MNPYNVIDRYAGDYKKIPSKNKLVVQTFRDEDGLDWVLIEGEEQAIEFLGKVITAQAKYKKDSHFHMSPKSAGRAWFKKNSTHGIYIHRLPCVDQPGVTMAKSLPK